MFTYSHANTTLSQSECAYYVNHFIKIIRVNLQLFIYQEDCLPCKPGTVSHSESSRIKRDDSLKFGFWNGSSIASNGSSIASNGSSFASNGSSTFSNGSSIASNERSFSSNGGSIDSNGSSIDSNGSLISSNESSIASNGSSNGSLIASN